MTHIHMTKEIPEWYDDIVKKINLQIWLPESVSKDDNNIYKFNGNKIEFSSFKNAKYSVQNKLFEYIYKQKEISHKYIEYTNDIIKNDDYINLDSNILQNFEKQYNFYSDHIKNYEPQYETINLETHDINNYKNKYNNLTEKYETDNKRLVSVKAKLSLKLEQYPQEIKIKFGKKSENDKNIILNNKQLETIAKELNNKTLNNKSMISLLKQQAQLRNKNNNLTKENMVIMEYFCDKTYDIKDYFRIISAIETTTKQMNTLNETYTKNINMINKELRTYKSKVYFNKIQKEKALRWIKEAERVYDTCVDSLYDDKDNFPNGFMKVRDYIFNKLYGGNPKFMPSSILGYSIIEFCDNLDTNLKAIKKGTKKYFTMKHKNCVNQRTITIRKDCINNRGLFITHLGEVKKFSKKIKIENIKCDCKLTYDMVNQNFYLYVPQYVTLKEGITNRKPICALDPGEKIFMTYYSLDGYGFIGNDVRNLILPKLEKIKKYQRLMKQTNENGKKRNRKNKHGKPLKRGKLKRKIKRLYRKIKGIINELHKKTAIFLCKNYDTILIPTFGTQNMVNNGDTPINPNEPKNKYKTHFIKTKNDIKKNNKDNPEKLKCDLKEYKKRSRLNSRVKFVLMQQSHYKFRQHLLNKSREYGCKCLEVTEEYTSKFCPICCKTDNTFKDRMKICKHCNYEIHRDVNGSRNILVKNIRQVLNC